MSGRFVIRNGSRWPDDEVRSLVRFAMQDIDTRALCVNVKRLTGAYWKGRAYEGVPTVSNAPAQAEYLVTLSVGEGMVYPATYRSAAMARADARVAGRSFGWAAAMSAAGAAKFPSTTTNPMANVEAISGLCFLGTGPKDGSWPGVRRGGMVW